MKEKNEKGRPSFVQQAKIESDLRPYFEKGYSATLTSKKTGHDKKTVLKYFKKWTKEIFEPESEEFLQRCKEQKERSLLALDEHIYSIEEDANDVGKIINDLKKSGNILLLEKFFKLKFNLKKEFAKLSLSKLQIVNSPTFDSLVNLDKNDGDSS